MEEDREEDRGAEMKAELWQRGRRESHRQENMLSPSLPHSPTHRSKYNDHRKVISKLNQAKDSEPTERHRTKRKETERGVGKHCKQTVCLYK